MGDRIRRVSAEQLEAFEFALPCDLVEEVIAVSKRARELGGVFDLSLIVENCLRHAVRVARADLDAMTARPKE
jgi:hypothetical protein